MQLEFLPQLAVMSNLIGQFAAVAKNTNKVAGVNVSRTERIALFNVDIVIKTNRQRGLYPYRQRYSS